MITFMVATHDLQMIWFEQSAWMGSTYTITIHQAQCLMKWDFECLIVN